MQSISNFMVSLPNLSKRCEGATVPAVAPSHIPDHWSKSGRAVARFSPSKSGRAVARFSPSKCVRAVAHISPCNDGKPLLPSKGKDGLFSSLLRISLLFLIVPVSVRTKRVLQAREIRRIDFSVAYRHDLRSVCKIGQRCFDR